MSTNNKIYCPKCGETFSRERRLTEHLEKKTIRCKTVEEFISAKTAGIEMKIEERVRADYEKRLTIIQENKNKIADALVNAPPGAKLRKKIVQNIEAENIILNFETVVQKTEIPKSVLRETVELMSDGDVILFKRIFIDHVPQNLRCIRVKDFARDKYEYYDGSVWVTTTLTYIVEQFANRLHSKYKFLIFEKANKIEEIDNMYSFKDYPEENAAEIDELTVQYAKVTEHVTKLGVNDYDFINEIKRGIRGLLNKPASKKNEPENTVQEMFRYDPEIESESISESDLDSDSDSGDNGDDPDKKKDLLVPILQILGIRGLY